MKKILPFVLIALLALSAAACGDDPAPADTATDTAADTAPETPPDTAEDSTPDTADESETLPDTAPDTDGESEETEDTVTVKNFTDVSPANGSEVILANDRVYAWSTDYSYRDTDSTDIYHQKEELYYPNPLTFSWTVAETPEYYRLTVSRHSDLSDGDSYLLNAPTLTLDTLFTGTAYYWQVDAVYADKTLRSAVYTFHTAESPRTLKIDGVSNTRDLGGAAAGEGYRFKQGMVYRTATIDGITDEGIDYFVNVLGLKTDLDLRWPGDGLAGVRSPFGDRVNYIQISGRWYLGANTGIDDAGGKQSIADQMRVFANPDNYPIVFHCSLGRDRTGTTAFLLEALVGVEINDLIQEYEMSYFASVGGEATPDAHTSNIMSVYRAMLRYEGDTLSDKVASYLLECGVSADEIASIRAILREEVQ